MAYNIIECNILFYVIKQVMYDVTDNCLGINIISTLIICFSDC